MRVDDGRELLLDRFRVWRDTGDIGFIMLAFSMIIEAIKDLVYGEPIDLIDAHSFWFASENDSLYPSSCNLWLDVLGMERMPDIVSDILYERKDLKDPEFKEELDEYLKNLEYLFTLVKTDYYYTNLKR